MAVVVEQTIPFDSKALDITNPSRWAKLLPLLRPSITAFSTDNDQTVLVDRSLSHSKDVRIAAIVQPGNFSSKLLEIRYVCAVATEAAGKESIVAEAIAIAVEKSGISLTPGLVIVRCGKQKRLVISDAAVEVEVNGDLEADHLLHLLGEVNEATRYAIQPSMSLLTRKTKAIYALVDIPKKATWSLSA